MNKDRIMAYIDNQSEIKKCVETQFPFFIAHEYHRFYELLEKGQLFGAFFEMKDVMEVLLNTCWYGLYRKQKGAGGRKALS